MQEIDTLRRWLKSREKEPLSIYKSTYEIARSRNLKLLLSIKPPNRWKIFQQRRLRPYRSFEMHIRESFQACSKKFVYHQMFGRVTSPNRRWSPLCVDEETWYLSVRRLVPNSNQYKGNGIIPSEFIVFSCHELALSWKISTKEIQICLHKNRKCNTWIKIYWKHYSNIFSLLLGREKFLTQWTPENLLFVSCMLINSYYLLFLNVTLCGALILLKKPQDPFYASARLMWSFNIL